VLIKVVVGDAKLFNLQREILNSSIFSIFEDMKIFASAPSILESLRTPLSAFEHALYWLGEQEQRLRGSLRG
jgi:hypothetical protein